MPPNHLYSVLRPARCLRGKCRALGCPLVVVTWFSRQWETSELIILLGRGITSFARATYLSLTPAARGSAITHSSPRFLLNSRLASTASVGDGKIHQVSRLSNPNPGLCLLTKETHRLSAPLSMVSRNQSIRPTVKRNSRD